MGLLRPYVACRDWKVELAHIKPLYDDELNMIGGVMDHLEDNVSMMNISSVVASRYEDFFKVKLKNVDHDPIFKYCEEHDIVSTYQINQ